MLKRSDIQIRDPFVVPSNGEYYLFGTTGVTFWKDRAEGFDPSVEGFDAFRSQDLENWEGPFRVFSTPCGFWADQNYWSPEVHSYQGRWFMLASFKASKGCRGTQILVADKLLGPYVPHSDGPVTPLDWESLDGTLFIDEAGSPWMVFCHEWAQVHDGEICAIPLSADLRRATGEPVLLFRASEAAWTVANPNSQDRVTDGPWLHRTSAGTLLMLWSSVGVNGYAVACARSTSGLIVGPWIQDSVPIYEQDGGHGMLFRTFGGELRLAIHGPNKLLEERPLFCPIVEQDDRLIISHLTF